MLIPDWKRVLRYAWSIRLIALTCLFSALEFALPFAHGWLPLRPGTFALLAFIVSIAAFVLRLIPQKTISGDRNDQDAE